MDRTFTVYQRFNTTASPEDVFTVLERSLHSTVGGSIARSGNGFMIRNGNNNLSFDFAAEIDAIINVSCPAPGTVEINGTIKISPNTLFWVCAVAGFFCLYFIWLVNLMYFVLDPRPNYQEALDRVPMLLTDQPGAGSVPPPASPSPPPDAFGV